MPATNYSSLTCNGDTPQIFLGSNRPAGSPSGTGNPVAGDPCQITALVSVQAVASATADYSVALPLGARIFEITILEQVAPTGTTPTFTAGSTVGGTDILASSLLSNSNTIGQMAVNGARPLLVANFPSIVASSAGGSIVSFRYAQGTPTAVGTFLIVIGYVMA